MRPSRIFTFAALALVFVHLVCLLTLGVTAAGVLASNVMQIAASLLAAITCLYVAEHSEGIARPYWRLVGSAFAIWSAAEVIWTFLDKPNQLAIPMLVPIDQIFFLAFAPFVVALLLDQHQSVEGIDWEHTLDIAQVVIVALAAYLYFFSVPHRLETPDIGMNRVLSQVFNSRNIFLSAAFLLRTLLTRSRTMRSLFGRTTVILMVYTIVTGLVNTPRLRASQTVADAVVTGKLYDLGWTVPFVCAVILVATWTPQHDPESLAPFEPAGLRGVLAVNLLPTLLPVIVLIMSASIVRQQVSIAAFSVLASFACYSARLGVTQHRQMRSAQALRDAEAKFRLLFACNPNPMWVCDTATLNFLEVNEAAMRMYEYSREEFLRLKASDIRPQEDVSQFIKILKKRTRGMYSIGNWRHQTKQGKLMNVAVTAADVVIEGHEAILVIAEDITRKLQLEEKLRHSQKMEAVGNLAGGIAHDFNNLLTVITGYTKLLQEVVLPESDPGRQLLQIERASERAATLTRQLLAFSRRQVLQPKLLNLNEVVSSLEKMLRRVIGEDIEMATSFSRDLGLVFADPGQLEQVVMSLALNAREAMPKGGKLSFSTINVELEESALQELQGLDSRQCAKLAISDSGCGMDASILSRVFEPFFTTKRERGAGLGLSTVYGIVQQSGGAIRVESQPGQGTTVTLYFPRAAATAETSPVEVAARSRVHGSETILLVEDDDGLRELSRRILDMNGYSVLAAARASEAEKLSQEHSGEIHMLVTDVIMPGMGGPELARKLATTRPQTKVLYMSGYTDNTIAEHGVLQPGIAFIQKPFSPTTLAQKIREVLDGATAPVQT